MEIRIEQTYKHRVPHKPTRAHRDRKKYTRKGRAAERARQEIRDKPGE